MSSIALAWMRPESMRAAFRAGLGIGLASALLTGGAAPASAAGGGGSDATSTMSPGRPEDPGYTAGVKAIKAGNYAAAIPLLEGAVEREKDNADALNWLAYATRKNGDAARSIPLYERALAIDPKHRGAHEYIGEAYLALGNLPKAKEHLARLDKLCLFTCSEYRDLKKAVQVYEASGARPAPAAGR